MPTCKVLRAKQIFCIWQKSQLFKSLKFILVCIFPCSCWRAVPGPSSSNSSRVPENTWSLRTKLNSQLPHHTWMLLPLAPLPWDFPPVQTKRVTYWSTILEQASPQSQWYNCWMTGTFSWTLSAAVSTTQKMSIHTAMLFPYVSIKSQLVLSTTVA